MDTASDEFDHAESHEPSGQGLDRQDLGNTPDEIFARLVPWLPSALTIAEISTTFEALEDFIKANIEKDVNGFVDLL